MEKSSMNAIKKMGLLIFFILLTACGSSTPGLDELKMLCEKDAGLTIYKIVEVEGYYDATGSNTIVAETDYQFIEFCDDNPTFIDAIPEPGCWRVSKIKRESGQCYERLDKSLAKIVVEPYPEFRKDHCLAVEKLDKPEAEYKYEVEREEWWINESTGTKMTSGTGRIVNNKTGEILGEGTNYVLYPKWFGTGRSLPSIHCGSPQITGLQKSIPFAAGLIEKTLMPETIIRTGEPK
jgi:hypothetical protein